MINVRAILFELILINFEHQGWLWWPVRAEETWGTDHQVQGHDPRHRDHHGQDRCLHQGLLIQRGDQKGKEDNN